MRRTEIIGLHQVATVPELFDLRVEYSSNAVAYRYFDGQKKCWKELTWRTMAACIQQWKAAFQHEGFKAGDRVAIMLANGPHWVMFDQAAMALGLVVVPLYVSDHAENTAYILQHSGAKLLLVNGPDQWQRLQSMRPQLNGLNRVLSLQTLRDPRSRNIMHVEAWLTGNSYRAEKVPLQADDLATIIYTSGTTGFPKGVMLSHRNLLHNSWAGLQHIRVYSDDLFLSFLPLSHTLERTAGYYLPMMVGAQVAYARSIPLLAEDLQHIKPTIMITVPRIFERIHGRLMEQIGQKSAFIQYLFKQSVRIGWNHFLYTQHRRKWHAELLLNPLLQLIFGHRLQQKLGGRMRFAISGGAALNSELAQTFIALGLSIQQGYGLTENSPVISVNPMQGNRPESVGTVLHGMEVKLDKKQQLLVRGPSVMSGYWSDPQATAESIDADGWLHTGDIVRLEDGYIYITGRLKEIIVLSNGEKISPQDMESSLMLDPIIEQAIVVGEGRPYLIALLVINASTLSALKKQFAPTEDDDSVLQNAAILKHMVKLARTASRNFPAYAKIRRVHLSTSLWSIDQGLLTPTLKLRRYRIIDHHHDDITRLYGKEGIST